VGTSVSAYSGRRGDYFFRFFRATTTANIPRIAKFVNNPNTNDVQSIVIKHLQFF
jgi:hypothetical protein